MTNMMTYEVTKISRTKPVVANIPETKSCDDNSNTSAFIETTANDPTITDIADNQKNGINPSEHFINEISNDDASSRRKTFADVEMGGRYVEFLSSVLPPLPRQIRAASCPSVIPPRKPERVPTVDVRCGGKDLEDDEENEIMREDDYYAKINSVCLDTNDPPVVSSDTPLSRLHLNQSQKIEASAVVTKVKKHQELNSIDDDIPKSHYHYYDTYHMKVYKNTHESSIQSRQAPIHPQRILSVGYVETCSSSKKSDTNEKIGSKEASVSAVAYEKDINDCKKLKEMLSTTKSTTASPPIPDMVVAFEMISPLSELSFEYQNQCQPPMIPERCQSIQAYIVNNHSDLNQSELQEYEMETTFYLSSPLATDSRCKISSSSPTSTLPPIRPEICQSIYMPLNDGSGLVCSTIHNADHDWKLSQKSNHSKTRNINKKPGPHCGNINVDDHFFLHQSFPPPKKLIRCQSIREGSDDLYGMVSECNHDSVKPNSEVEDFYGCAVYENHNIDIDKCLQQPFVPTFQKPCHSLDLHSGDVLSCGDNIGIEQTQLSSLLSPPLPQKKPFGVISNYEGRRTSRKSLMLSSASDLRCVSIAEEIEDISSSHDDDTAFQNQ